jgi:hypothetical protein
LPIYTTLVDDAFPQADGPLELVNWTVASIGGAVNAQVVSHRCESSSTTFGSIVVYTGASGWIVGGQFAEITIHALSGNPSTDAMILFMFADLAVATGVSATLTPIGGGQFTIQAFSSNTGLNIGPLLTETFVADAKYRIELLAGTLTQFYNDLQIAQTTGLTDELTDSGLPGIYMLVSTAVTAMQISRFTAGTISASPGPTSGGSGLGFDFRYRF